MNVSHNLEENKFYYKSPSKFKYNYVFTLIILFLVSYVVLGYSKPKYIFKTNEKDERVVDNSKLILFSLLFSLGLFALRNIIVYLPVRFFL